MIRYFQERMPYGLFVPTKEKGTTNDPHRHRHTPWAIVGFLAAFCEQARRYQPSYVEIAAARCSSMQRR